MERDCLGVTALARALSDLSENPVMLLYIYDGDFWGYDFYSGKEEDHFRTRPDAFGPVSPREKQRLSGDPAALSGWLPTWDTEMIGRYLVHWPDLDEGEMEGTACPGDQFPYGDCWQMTDFMARLEFPYHAAVMGEFAEKKRGEEEREARRLQLILEKRRKGKK